MKFNTSHSALVFATLVATSTTGAQIEEIAISGRKVNLVGAATSASEGLISREELALRPLLRTGDVLESVPGLVATQHSGSGKANQFFLRGFNLDHGTDFATFVDDMPINMRTHGHGQGYTDLNFLIPELIEEISFRKGSYYADAGDFSGTGSARIATARQAKGHRISATAGSYGYQRLLVSGAVPAANGTVIYGVEEQAYEGPWDQINEDVSKTNLQLGARFNAYLRLREFADYPLDGGQTADGSSLLSLRAGYDFTPRFNMSLDVLNMLDSDDHDVEYFYESQLAGETGPVEDKHFHVFEPASFRIYANYQF